jgi:hypothetical protein
MSTIRIDPVAIRARYNALTKEAARLKVILDVLPDLEDLSSGNGDAHASRIAPRVIRAVPKKVIKGLRKFVVAYRHPQFRVPDVMEWFKASGPSSLARVKRTTVTAALRQMVAEGDEVEILVAGQGRRAQVYGLRRKAKEDAIADTIPKA